VRRRNWRVSTPRESTPSRVKPAARVHGTAPPSGEGAERGDYARGAARQGEAGAAARARNDRHRMKVGMKTRRDRQAQCPRGGDRGGTERALRGNMHEVGPIGAPAPFQPAARGQAEPEQRVARDGQPGRVSSRKLRSGAASADRAATAGRPSPRGPRRPSSRAMTPKVIATPLISGGKVSVTRASFTCQVARISPPASQPRVTPHLTCEARPRHRNLPARDQWSGDDLWRHCPRTRPPGPRGDGLPAWRPGLPDAAARPEFRELTLPGLPIPGYALLRLGLPARRRLERCWRADRPDLVACCQEGPLGASAVTAARALGLPVTSSFIPTFISMSSLRARAAAPAHPCLAAPRA